MTEIIGTKPDFIIMDDIVDKDGNTTQKVTVLDLKTISATMLGLSLLPYQELIAERIMTDGNDLSLDDQFSIFADFKNDPLLLAGPSFFNTGRIPSPNMIHAMDARNHWSNKIDTKPRPRSLTKRQKTLKARTLNKANRKRARHG